MVFKKLARRGRIDDFFWKVHYQLTMSCALMANSPSFSILQINVMSSKYSNTKSRAHYVIADF